MNTTDFNEQVTVCFLFHYGFTYKKHVILRLRVKSSTEGLCKDAPSYILRQNRTENLPNCFYKDLEKARRAVKSILKAARRQS